MEHGVRSLVPLRHLAVVGVSRTPKESGNMIFKETGARGNQVYGVHRFPVELFGRL